MIDEFNTDADELVKTCLKDAKNITDGNLSYLMRAVTTTLNGLAEEAAKRELIVSYRIKAPETGATRNPKIIVNVMTEVI